MKKSLFNLFVVFLIAFTFGSCKSGSHNFFKQKYLKGNLKPVYEDGQESVQETVTFKDDVDIEIDFKTEQEVEIALVSDKIDNDKIEIIEASERPRNISSEGLGKVFESIEKTRPPILKKSGFKKHIKQNKLRSGGDGEFFLAFLVVFFLILAVLSLILLIWIGGWAFLISFGLIIIAFLLYLWFNSLVNIGGHLLGLIGAIVLFPAAILILLLTMLIRWIVSLF